MFKKKPFFIVFEGVEGCGKSYQSKKLIKNLKKKGLNPILTREPGGTKSAESIRTLILKDYFNKGKYEKGINIANNVNNFIFSFFPSDNKNKTKKLRNQNIDAF